MLTKEQLELVQQNTGLVRNMVNKFYRFAQTYTYEDLLQCGYIGLIKAVKTYDDSKEAKFSTYACKLIQYAILDALRDTDRIVHVPTSMMHHVKKFKEERKENGITVKEYAKRNSVSIGHLRQALYASRQILYLEEPAIYSEEEFVNLMDLLTDNRNDTEGSIQCKEIKEKLEHEFQYLIATGTSEKYIAILKSYFGIEEEPKTMQEIGTEYGLSQNRISQILHQLERKMRYHLCNEKELLESCEEFNMRDYE